MFAADAARDVLDQLRPLLRECPTRQAGDLLALALHEWAHLAAAYACGQDAELDLEGQKVITGEAPTPDDWLEHLVISLAPLVFVVGMIPAYWLALQVEVATGSEWLPILVVAPAMVVTLYVSAPSPADMHIALHSYAVGRGEQLGRRTCPNCGAEGAEVFAASVSVISCEGCEVSATGNTPDHAAEVMVSGNDQLEEPPFDVEVEVEVEEF